MKTTKPILFLFLGILFLCNCPEPILRITRLETTQITEFTAITAKAGLKFIDLSGKEISAFGHCWNKSGNPTIMDSKNTISAIPEIKEYENTLSGLDGNTKYYVRAYATESGETIYGNVVEFTTVAVNATTITKPANNISGTSATLNGTINPNGETATISFEWGTSVAYGNTVNAIPATVNGTSVTNVSAEISGLTNGTTYHFKLKAEKAGIIAYGEDLSFVTYSLSTVTTDLISTKTHNTATMGGNVTNDGGTAVTEKGVCWGINANPDATGTHQALGNGIGAFSQNISGLNPTTTYHVRAYAINSIGPAYGSDESFTTGEIPKINVTSPTGSDHWIVGETKPITWNATNVSGNVDLSLYKADVFQSTLYSGVPASAGMQQWIISGNYVYAKDYKIRVTSSSDVSLFGENPVFTLSEQTGATGILTDKEANSYTTIKIGKQWWMAQNIKVRYYSDGSSLANGIGIGDITGNYTTKYYFAYGDIESNVATYGRLYTWAAAMNGSAGSDLKPSGVQGICPIGWHLPSDNEWKELEVYIGMLPAQADLTAARGTTEGGELKESGTTHWASPNTGANNEFLYSALPAGYFYYTGGFYQIYNQAYFWTTSDNGNDAMTRLLKNDDARIIRNLKNKSHGMSVRCVKN